MKSLLLAACFALSTLAAPTTNVTLAPRKDYESDDVLKRTFYYCNNDPTIEQDETKLYAFKTNTPGHLLGYVYDFEYYNHR